MLRSDPKILPSIVAALAATSPVFGQSEESPEFKEELRSEDPGKAETYPRAFFDTFFPQTALDMLERVPGFTIDGGSDLRGFGGGAGNVLIDGERPTIKSGGLEDFLARIPANAVDRIEVTRGAQRAGETAGQSVTANVIRKDVGFSGTWSAELERAADGLVYPRGEVSITAPLGEWTTTTKLNGFWERFPWTEFDRITLDPAGNLQLFEEETAPSSLGQIYLATEAKRLLGGGTLTINGRFGYSDFGRNTERLGFVGRLPDGPTADRRTDIRFDSTIKFDGELSVDWTKKVNKDWSLKILALGSIDDLEESSVNVTEEPIGQPVSASRFQAEAVPIELLSRITYGKQGGTFRPEFGGEIAYNSRDTFFALEVEDANGVRAIDLPAADVTVSEWRGEIFANTSWKFAPKWTAEAGLGAEFSSIRVTGDAENSNSFFFVKPSAALTYAPSDKVQFRLAARRTVGQLNFSDFAASAQVEDDRLIGGNPDLGPDQTTRLSLSGDFRIKSGAALSLEAFHEWRSDVLEQVILPSDVTGLANAGDARFWGLDVDASLPLTAILPGALLEVEAEFRDARFVDPLTGDARKITGLQSPNIDIDFRHDLTKERFAWGVRYEPRIDIFRFFANESIEEARGDRWTAFIETTRFFGVKMNLEVRNIGGQIFPRERFIFTPDRSGTLSSSEILERTRGAFVKFTVSDQF